MKSIKDIIQESNSDESTVGWLISELQKLPKHYKVTFDINDDGVHIYEDVKSVKVKRNKKLFVCIHEIIKSIFN